MTDASDNIGVPPLAILKEISGLEFLVRIIDGRLPRPPITETLGFALTEVSPGFALFTMTPQFRHYNPIGTVHGGWTATLLDSAMGCSIFSTMSKGEAWTTLEFKVNFVRRLDKDTGPVRAEARIIHRGRTMATAEGDLKDSSGKLYAHANTTCMVFPGKAD